MTVTVNDDALDEVDETFLVTLSNPTHAAIVGGPGTGTIVDNDAEPTMTIDDATVTEGNTGITMATFVIRLSTASGRAVTGNFGTANGTATAGSDYTATAGPFTVAAGSTTLAVQVPITGDVTQEPNEAFVLNLTGVSGAVVADAQATGTIQNDDVPAAGGLIAAYAFEENSGTTVADATGKGHTGTVSGTDWADDGKSGRGLWFPGTNNWVNVADANDLDLTRGDDARGVGVPAFAERLNTIMMKQGTSGQFGYSLYAKRRPAAPGGAPCRLRTSIGRRSTAALRSPPGHSGGNRRRHDAQALPDGVQIGSRAQTRQHSRDHRALRLGGERAGGEYFHGIMDDVRFTTVR